MTSKETILTAEGLAKLEAELEELRTVKRLENEERLHEAIAHGDLMKTPSMFQRKMSRPVLKAVSWNWNRWSIRPKLLTIQKNGKRRLN